MAQTSVLEQQARPATVPRDSERLEKTLVVVITVLPFLAFLTGVWLLWNRGISALDVGMLVGLYYLSGLGVTVGFHRYFAHQSFEASPKLRVGLAVAGSLSVQGAIIPWVADHRRHHQFSDKPGDPHSPHLEEAEGLRGVLLGLWHAHTGWFFDNERTVVDRYAPDLLRDPAIVRVSRLFPMWTAISLALPAAIGFAVTGTLFGAATGFLWGGLVRVFFLHHVTWSINSICHYFGNRPYESKDLSTNNWPMAIISFGESWHNNHHAFPSSAIHGLERWQLDLSAWVIKRFEGLGLVRNVKVPDPAYREKKLREPTSTPVG